MFNGPPELANAIGRNLVWSRLVSPLFGDDGEGAAA